MADSYSLSVASSCTTDAAGSGQLAVTTKFSTTGGPISDEVGTRLYLLDNRGLELESQVADRNTSTTFGPLPNGAFGVEWRETDSQLVLARGGATVQCGPLTGVGLSLDSLSYTDETAAGDDGTATVVFSGGEAPLSATLVELSITKSATAGQPTVFTGLPPARYRLRLSDSTQPTAQFLEVEVTIGPYKAPVAGCQDEYALNYDPDATSSGSCDYAPSWRSAWARGNMPVVVPALTTDTKSFLTAKLRVGFREGHPLHDFRPLGEAIILRATIGPDGYGVFRLGPILRPLLGVADGLGGYRLDINTETVDDFYVGYELRRTTGELLEHGYAVNSAVPDEEVFEGRVLTAFGRVPSWPGYSWKRARLANRSAGRYGAIDEVYPDTVNLPCPPNPLPVAWLNPQGGWDFWVFQGRPQLGDDVSDGQTYTEPESRERRYSDPGEARQTIKASSGAFGGDDLLRGLRTLWRSPQVWYQPDPAGEWIAVTVERGQRDVGRLGVRRQELTISFTHAAPEAAQGQ